MRTIARSVFVVLIFTTANIQLSAQGVGKVDFSVERGYYDNPFTLTLSCDDPAATIRYTTDGTRPDATNGIFYTAPIVINTTDFIRAIAYNGIDTADVETHTYIFLDDVITSPVMNTAVTNSATYGPQMRAALEALPSVSIVTGNPANAAQVIDYITTVERETSVELIYHDGTPDFQIDAGIKESGNTVDVLAKRAYRLIFSKDYGPGKMDYPLFNGFGEGVEPVEEFDRIQLRGGSDDAMTATSGTTNALYMRQRFMENVQLELGEISSHGRYMHIYVNGEYYGQWHVQERPDAHFHASYYGGDNCDFDVINKQVAVGSCPEANLNAWNTAYALRGSYSTIQQSVDIENLANYSLMNIWADGNSGGNEDVMYGRKRQPGEKFHFYCWDSDRIWYNVNANSVTYFSGQGNPRGLFLSLMDLHVDYRMLAADRAYCMFFNNGLLTPAKNAERLQKLETQIAASILGETARWADITKLQTWENRLDYMYNTYFPQRTNIVIGHLRSAGYYPSIDPPIFNLDGGLVSLGDQLTLTNPNGGGTIYYTIDGTDPRDAGGTVSTLAQTYSSPIIMGLAGAIEVKARVLNNGEWSAMCPVSFYPPQNYTNVAINEINYNPGEACQAAYNSLDYIEITNAGTVQVDISGTKLAEGISYTFPVGTILQPDDYIVLAESKANFELAYGFAPFGQYSGDLDNGGELISYTNFDGSVVIDTVHYDDIAPWAEAADGDGSSLELISPALDNALGTNWQASGDFCGSPGAANVSTCTAASPMVIFNEIDYNTTFPNTGDWLELHNPNSSAVDLSAWELRDENNVYLFPNGTIIPADGYLVVAQNSTLLTGVFPSVTNYVGSIVFGFADGGELLTLLDAAGCLIDQLEYDDKLPWATEPDLGTTTLSLIDPSYNNDLPASWVPSSQGGANYGTPGAPNNIPPPCTPTPASIVINEINYNPDSLNNAGDWIELYNPNAGAVDISNWRILSENDGYIIPVSTTIPADGYLVVVEEVDLFTNMFPNTPNYISGVGLGFSKGGELIQLMSPASCVVDSLTYDDAPPWDTIPDGNGPTLSLINPTLDNALPISWENSGNIDAPYGTPGRVNAPCPEIAIESEGEPCVGEEVIFTVDSIYAGMSYSWSFPGGSPAASDGSTETVVWNTVGTYTVELTTVYFDCIEVYTVSIIVSPICNTPPIPEDDMFSVQEDGTLSENVLLNDIDPEGDNLVLDINPQTPPSNGMLTLNTDGTFVYTPNADFYGTDNFTYTVCDSVITSTFTPGFFTGAVMSGEDDVEELADTGVIITGSGDLDLVEDPDTFIVGIRIRNITIPADAIITNAYLEFVADEADAVATSLTIGAENIGHALPIPSTDFGLSSKTKTATSIAWEPEAWTVGNTYTTTDISALIQELVSRGDWQDGNAMTFIIEGTGTRTAESYEGAAPPTLYVDYETATDVMDFSLCETAVATITVTPVNDTPIAIDDTGTTDEDVVLVGSVMINDNDIDGVLTLTTTSIIPPQNGSVTLNANGVYVYVPDLNFNGTDSFEYEVCDDGTPSLCDRAIVNITVNSVNDAPTVVDDIATVGEDGVLNSDVSYNDTDLDGNTLTYVTTPTIAPANGLVIINPGGTYIYTPNADFNGIDSFEYGVCDGGNPTLCGTATVTITVNPVNDPPYAIDDTQMTTEDQGLNGNIISNDINVDADAFVATETPVVDVSNGSVFILPNGFYVYTPNNNFFGTDSFQYEVCDNSTPVLCDTALVTITVSGINDAPIAVVDTIMMVSNTSIQDNILLNDSDIENDVLTATVTPIVAPANGMLIIQANGNIDYTPDANYSGVDEFTYEVCDDGTPSTCNTATVVIIIEVDCVEVELFAWMEGAYDTLANEMNTTLNTIRGLLPGQTPAGGSLATATPAGQPYNIAPWNYNGTEGAGWTDAEYEEYPIEIVDWVLIGFRTNIGADAEIAQAAGLIHKNGSVSFPDRCALPATAGLDSVYVVLEHRNHMGIMTPGKVPLTDNVLTYDFRLADTYTDPTSFGQKQLPSGSWGMYAGDGDQSDFPSYDISAPDKAIWFSRNGVFNIYLPADYNMDGDISGADKILWSPNNGISSRVPK